MGAYEERRQQALNALEFAGVCQGCGSVCKTGVSTGSAALHDRRAVQALNVLASRGWKGSLCGVCSAVEESLR